MSDQLPPRPTESYRDTWRDAADKFDGTLTAAVATIAGYAGQNLHPGRLGLNPTTLEVLALAVLLYALLASFRRHEAVMFARRHETDRMFFKEEAEAMHMAAERARLTPGAVLTNAATGERATPDDIEAGAAAFRRDAAALSAPIDRAHRAAARLYRSRTNALLADIGLLVAARVWTAYTPAPGPTLPSGSPNATRGVAPR
jgi:hypothetical protein